MVIELDAWEFFDMEDGCVLAVFSSGDEIIELRLTPAKVVEGIAKATKCLIRGGVLPREECKPLH